MASNKQLKTISWLQYSKHITPQDCWVLIDGNLYDVSDYLVEHPGGDDILLKYSGIDASIPFNQQNHSKYALSLRDARIVGKIQSPVYDQTYRLMLQKKKKILKQSVKNAKKTKSIRNAITIGQVAQNNNGQSCWIVIQGKVYDVTSYLSSHPGGEGLILDQAGKDATKAFDGANHSFTAIEKRNSYLIGNLQKSSNKNSTVLIFVLIFILSAIGGWILFGSPQI